MQEARPMTWLTPEISGQLRTFLAAVGGFGVAKGWMSATLLEPAFGLVALIWASWWSYRAKQAESKEAQKVAVIVARDKKLKKAAHL